MKSISFVIALAIALPLSAVANCPRPNQIFHTCATDKKTNHRICYWYVRSPGWTGYPITLPRLEIRHPRIKYFHKAAWWKYPPHIKNKIGTTFCFYYASNGSLVRFSQDDYGGVTQPEKNDLWQSTTIDGHPMLVCRASIRKCKFDY